MLEENNVKLVGVGVEELGVKEFIDRKYLDGGKSLRIDMGEISNLCLHILFQY